MKPEGVSAQETLGRSGKLGAEIGMCDRDQFAGSFALRFTLQRRDPILRHHVMDEGPRQGAYGARRKRGRDTGDARRV